MPKLELKDCASICDINGDDNYDSKSAHELLVLAGYYISHEEIVKYMETLNKSNLNLGDIENFISKDVEKDIPKVDMIRNLLKSLDMNNSDNIDVSTLKYGLSSLGNDKLNDLEIKDLFKTLGISKDTEIMSIKTIVENIEKVLKLFD
ncbi:uncharacterized protein CMU_024460 [Cryptosporidium muris RN66]|uniref:EF-hand domain-containing protein n=1 Tax=Cryptosporidium muris (strain RN66) TaxID=441375 RepID=B6AAN8_CRYMR|nr:uncharacterized protein CMU_024460 [Cryptosporidium muris RN66]EEA05440.1 hypothetical protein CMU_024460 [Cryptosporidium muris RN66]|eukprot:XP_002139789.1 hypothetical protein [Cryptosporidium muris RN66]